MASFKIGREFFAKSKADYADWRWSWVREISNYPKTPVVLM